MMGLYFEEIVWLFFFYFVILVYFECPFVHRLSLFCLFLQNLLLLLQLLTRVHVFRLYPKSQLLLHRPFQSLIRTALFLPFMLCSIPHRLFFCSWPSLVSERLCPCVMERYDSFQFYALFLEVCQISECEGETGDITLTRWDPENPLKIEQTQWEADISCRLCTQLAMRHHRQDQVSYTLSQFALTWSAIRSLVLAQSFRGLVAIDGCEKWLEHVVSCSVIGN